MYICRLISFKYNLNDAGVYESFYVDLLQNAVLHKNIVFHDQIYNICLDFPNNEILNINDRLFKLDIEKKLKGYEN